MSRKAVIKLFSELMKTEVLEKFSYDPRTSILIQTDLRSLG